MDAPTLLCVSVCGAAQSAWASSPQSCTRVPSSIWCPAPRPVGPGWKRLGEVGQRWHVRSDSMAQESGRGSSHRVQAAGHRHRLAQAMELRRPRAAKLRFSSTRLERPQEGAQSQQQRQQDQQDQQDPQLLGPGHGQGAARRYEEEVERHDRENGGQGGGPPRKRRRRCHDRRHVDHRKSGDRHMPVQNHARDRGESRNGKRRHPSNSRRSGGRCSHEIFAVETGSSAAPDCRVRVQMSIWRCDAQTPGASARLTGPVPAR